MWDAPLLASGKVTLGWHSGENVGRLAMIVVAHRLPGLCLQLPPRRLMLTGRAGEEALAAPPAELGTRSTVQTPA